MFRNVVKDLIQLNIIFFRHSGKHDNFNKILDDDALIIVMLFERNLDDFVIRVQNFQCIHCIGYSVRSFLKFLGTRFSGFH